VSRIERLLTRFPEDQRELRLTVTHKPKRYDLHVVLLLPTGSLAADASSATDREAIDAVVDKLAAELRRHKELIRHEHLYRRKQHRQELSRRAAAQLQPETRPLDREAFFNLLNPLMDRLRDHAQHELLVAELQGRIGREEVTVTDLLDEVIVRAWAQLAHRDETEPVEVWLTRLLHEVLDQQIADTQAVHSIYERVDAGNSDAQAAAARASEDGPVWEEPSTVMLEDVLPSHEVGEPWQQLEAIDQMKWVLAQLGTVSAAQRRAFTLHLLDGWEPDEIAMVQGRSVEEVRGDIEAVRQILRDRLGGELEIRPSSPAPGHHAE
jgi:DNA-directed RNA polymerase specialized sigma24 family protein/ribosome-associated translation inhibitor RaiA